MNDKSKNWEKIIKEATKGMDSETTRRSLELVKKQMEVLDNLENIVILHLKTHKCCNHNTDCQQLGEQLFKLKEPVVKEMCIFSPSGILERDFNNDWHERFLKAWRIANARTK